MLCRQRRWWVIDTPTRFWADRSIDRRVQTRIPMVHPTFIRLRPARSSRRFATAWLSWCRLNSNRNLRCFGFVAIATAVGCKPRARRHVAAADSPRSNSIRSCSNCQRAHATIAVTATDGCDELKSAVATAAAAAVRMRGPPPSWWLRISMACCYIGAGHGQQVSQSDVTAVECVCVNGLSTFSGCSSGGPSSSQIV